MGQASSSADQFRLAVWNGRLDTMKMLALNVDGVRLFDKKGRPVIHLAVANHQCGALKWLLQAGLDPNTPDSYGVRALHRALWAGDEVMIRILLDFGADPDARFPNGEKPVEVAASKNKFDIVRMLLGQSHTSSHKQNDSVENVKHELTDMNCIEKKIFRSPSKRRTGGQGVTPLHLAAQNGHWDIMAALVSRDYSLDARTSKDDRFALLEACASNQFECVQELLRLGASLSLKNRDDFLTPLMWTAKLGHKHIMSLLLRWGSNVHTMRLRNKAIHWAYEYKNIDCLRLLLEYGAGCSKHVCEDHSMPIIHRIVLSFDSQIKKIRILRIFVHANADLNFEWHPRDRVGRETPFAIAMKKRHYQVACWLANFGCKIRAISLDFVRNPYKLYLSKKDNDVPSLLALCRTNIRQRFGHDLHRYIQSMKCPVFIERYITFADILHEEMELPFSTKWRWMR